MKIVIVNGSPRKKGNCDTAIKKMSEIFEQASIEVEVLHVGNKKITGCMACNKCATMQNETCSISDDKVNEYIQAMKQADGIILASPVYFAGVAGTMKAFLDRVFYVSAVNGNLFRHKAGASFVALRRSGGISTLNELNHFLSFSETFMATANYWAIGHGRDAGEINDDTEADQIARLLAKNTTALLHMLEQGRNKQLLPEGESKIFTNFVR